MHAFKMITISVLSILCLSGIASSYMASNNTNVCCDGTVGPLGMECCGDKPYNASEQFCCGELSPLKKGQDSGCCKGTEGSKVYDRSTHFCCGGEVTPGIIEGLHASNFQGCCDNPQTKTSTPFINAIQLCCNGVVKPMEDENGYYQENAQCCGDKIIANPNFYPCPMYSERMISPFPYFPAAQQLCCGDQEPYDSMTQLCASSYDPKTQKSIFKVFPKENDNQSTCGLEVYDITTQDCCNQTPFDKKTAICCSDKIIKTEDSKLMSCCYPSGDIFDMTKQYCSNKGIEQLDEAVQNQYKKFIEMCDASFFPINLPTYSNVVSKDGYQTSNGTHICCNGKVGDISMSCCGTGKLYDPNTKVCCNNKVKKPKGKNNLATNNGCCVSEDGKKSSLYNYNTDVCCSASGEVLKKDTSDKDSYPQCCTNPTTKKSELFTYQNARCCKGVVMKLPNANKTYECCANELLESNYDIVEFGQKGASDRCCGEDYRYNQASQICASTYDRTSYKTTYEVLPLENNHTSTCGLKTYDTEKQGCCEEEIYPTETKYCCNSKLVSSPHGANSACCYQNGEIYNSRKQKCDGTGVSDLDEAIQEDIAKCGPTFPPNIYSDTPVIVYDK